jgi:hypothetical protein
MSQLLNNAQFAVLEWISAGCPDDQMTEYSHRVSAAALRSRGLSRIHGRGQTWRAELTNAGRPALEAPPPPKPARASAGPCTARGKARATRGGERDEQVPRDLRGAHPLLQGTRAATNGRHAMDDGRLMVGPQVGLIYMQVSRGQLRRTLLIAHGVIQASLHRGHRIGPYSERRHGEAPGVAVVVDSPATRRGP